MGGEVALGVVEGGVGSLNSFGIPILKGAPVSSQERAYTSPIWYPAWGNNVGVLEQWIDWFFSLLQLSGTPVDFKQGDRQGA